MDLNIILSQYIQEAFIEIYQTDIYTPVLQPTHKEYDGTYTLVTYPYLKISKTSPENTGKAIGEYLLKKEDVVKTFNVVKGFLNIELTDHAWLTCFNDLPDTFVDQDRKNEEWMVEFSSPNTNKPLHLGHLRNNFLGYSVARILAAIGSKIHKVQIINDRGIQICKSMVAWKRYGKGESPESSQLKGDKLVGRYYVRFDEEYKREVNELLQQGKNKEDAKKEAPILVEAQEMLRQWEKRAPEVMALWEQMNSWVYEGFEQTYATMGVFFDKLYYESQTYKLGKEEVLKGVKEGIFFQKEDGSVWVDLTDEGLDEKLLLRADGTSVYMTQDIGTAIQRFRDFPGIKGQIYTVGNEQDYHFKVLFLILKKLGFSWASQCFHLSYGMVDLPSGKMKSREGTVVDADDLMEEMFTTAERQTRELGKIEGLTTAQAEELYKILGLGALKYFLLTVDPKKRMLFDPGESIQFQGNTGPFIQYTHARICAILRRADELEIDYRSHVSEELGLSDTERTGIYYLSIQKEKVMEAARSFSPAIIAHHVYDMAREYNHFYAELPIFNEKDEELRQFRVAYSYRIAKAIDKGMGLLGINVPERM